MSIEAPYSRRKSGWFILMGLILAGLASLSIDIPVAAIVKEKLLSESMDRLLRDALENCETFGHGFGATLIIVAVAILAPQYRWDLPWVVSGSLGAGVVANLFKLCIRRIRPVHFDLSSGTVWNTFDRSFNTEGGMHSFPSAHTATAVGLAVMLASLFPRGKWYFAVLAFLVGLQRIVSSAHFPSDVCAGAAVGWLVGTACAAWMTSNRSLLKK
jgi:membrane-associated phospholipid phosphatase